MCDYNLQKLRALAREIAKRARDNPTFKEQLKQDPQGTLARAGLPQTEIESLIREARLCKAFSSTILDFSLYAQPL